MAIDLGVLGPLGFTENQAKNQIEKNQAILEAWIDFLDGVGFTVDYQREVATKIFADITNLGGTQNTPSVGEISKVHGVPVTWVQEVIDSIESIVRQNKNGAIPTEE